MSLFSAIGVLPRRTSQPGEGLLEVVVGGGGEDRLGRGGEPGAFVEEGVLEGGEGLGELAGGEVEAGELAAGVRQLGGVLRCGRVVQPVV
jgi:hypothetical protein